MLESADGLGILAPLSISCGSKIPALSHSSSLCKMATISLPWMIAKHLVHAGSSLVPIDQKEPTAPRRLSWSDERSFQCRVLRLLQPTRPRAPPHPAWFAHVLETVNMVIAGSQSISLRSGI